VIELVPERPACVEREADVLALGRIALRRNGATVAIGIVTETWGEDELRALEKEKEKEAATN
jgi:elongation factor 1 alpha-like protein